MTIKDLVTTRKNRSRLIRAASFLPDRLYLRLYYFASVGRFPNLRHPVGYNEKLQWLKLHGDYSAYTDYADKLKVRDIVREKIGEGYSFDLLGQWESFEEIDFSALPNEFVLKCNHDSGSTKIIRDKSKLTAEDYRSLREFYHERLAYDYFAAGREPSYRGIAPKIFAEKRMKEDNGDFGGLRDYKFFCFNGEPVILLIATDRETDPKFDFFDMDFNHLPIVKNHPRSDKEIPKPEMFEEMKRIVAILSEGIPHVRIDLYMINDRIYFGEYTFFSGGGFSLFNPPEWERKMGDMIQLDRGNSTGFA